jgi:hypothetical protein
MNRFIILAMVCFIVMVAGLFVEVAILVAVDPASRVATDSSICCFPFFSLALVIIGVCIAGYYVDKRREDED